jgi:hypothetical protein
MTDKPHGKQWQWRLAAWIVVALLALYVLSMGPAYKCAQSTGDDGFIVIYAPLEWAMANCGPVDFILRWELRLWGLPVNVAGAPQYRLPR